MDIYWQMKVGETEGKIETDGSFFKELINLDWWSLMAGCCKRRKTKYSLQFEKRSDFSILASKFLAERAHRNALAFFCSSFCDSLYPSILLFLLLIFQSLCTSSVYFSTSVYLVLLPVMTHWTCPDCGVPPICKHGIFWARGKKMAAIWEE